MGIECRQSLDVKLLTPEFLRVHVNMEVVNPRYTVSFTINCTADGADNEKDPRKVSHSSGNTPSKPSVSLVQGRLFFRDGIFLFNKLVFYLSRLTHLLIISYKFLTKFYSKV